MKPTSSSPIYLDGTERDPEKHSPHPSSILTGDSIERFCCFNYCNRHISNCWGILGRIVDVIIWALDFIMLCCVCTVGVFGFSFLMSIHCLCFLYLSRNFQFVCLSLVHNGEGKSEIDPTSKNFFEASINPSHGKKFDSLKIVFALELGFINVKGLLNLTSCIK